MNYIKTLSLFLSHWPFRVSLTFYKCTWCFPLSKWLFDVIHFLTEPWEGLGQNFSMIKTVQKNIWNTHKLTQFSTLIPNMVLVLTSSVFFSAKSAITYSRYAVIMHGTMVTGKKLTQTFFIKIKISRFERVNWAVSMMKISHWFMTSLGR